MAQLDREKLFSGLLIALTVAILGSIASTINSIVTTERPSINISRQQRTGGPPRNIDANVTGANGPMDGGQAAGGQTVDLVICMDFLTQAPVILAIVGGGLLISAGVYRRFNAASTLLVGAVLVPIISGVYFLLTNCTNPDSPGSQGGFFSGGEVMAGGSAVNAPPVPAEAVGVFFGLILIAGVALMFTFTSEEETYEPAADEEDADPDTAAFARAAGRAADRIAEENASVDNAVYRAWLEMTGILDLENPETIAPRDFAREAIDIGLAADDVNELTELFNEVRYGGKDATPREDRALEILRNIESTYPETVADAEVDDRDRSDTPDTEDE